MLRLELRTIILVNVLIQVSIIAALNPVCKDGIVLSLACNTSLGIVVTNTSPFERAVCETRITRVQVHLHDAFALFAEPLLPLLLLLLSLPVLPNHGCHIYRCRCL